MRAILLFTLLFSFTSCYKAKPIRELPQVRQHIPRTLFIGLDGVDHTLVKELKDEGYFLAFQNPIPLVTTFPSATTIAFTGIFRSLGNGKTYGYESRFYDRAQNKIVGASAKDLYKYPLKYKSYFDYFRHTIQSKMTMYTFPSKASKQDLVNTRNTVMSKDKNIMFAYLGGTDGSSHLLGRNRTKRTLKFMDEFLLNLQRRHIKEKGEPIRIVLFSDHGFDFKKLKNVKTRDIKRQLKNHGYNFSTTIKSKDDVVFTRFGVISGGAVFTDIKNRDHKAKLISKVNGMDLVFWHNNNKHRIYITSHNGEEAYFEYKGKRHYRYVTINGDPLNYKQRLQASGKRTNQWIQDSVWKDLFFDHKYPDAGYRLYDSFFGLVKNSADILYSLKTNYQYGSATATIGTWSRLGQRGTHGNLQRQSSWAFAMTNSDQNPNPPKYFRYDEFFNYYLPHITKAYKKKLRLRASKHHHNDHQQSLKSDHSFKQQLMTLQKKILM